MFYLIEEHEFASNTIVRYTICSTEDQFLKTVKESPAACVDGYEFSTAEELRDYLRESVINLEKS